MFMLCFNKNILMKDTSLVRVRLLPVGRQGTEGVTATAPETVDAPIAANRGLGCGHAGAPGRGGGGCGGRGGRNVVLGGGGRIRYIW